MKEYLLILLIFMIRIKTNLAYPQMITITQAGRTIISPAKPGNQIITDSFSNNIPAKKEQIDRCQLIKPSNYIDFDKQSNVKPTKIVSPPLNGKLYVKSGFGERFHLVLDKEILHAGIDIRADYEMVHTIANGIIVKEDYEPRTGNYLVIEHGDGIESIYCHLSKFLCKPGDVVFAGEGIAISGSTGAATAPHLHFSIKVDGKFTDPELLLKVILGYNKMH